MEANSSSVLMLPLQGDFASGLRTKSDAVRIRGNFATGVTNRPEALIPRHHGDFAAGIRARLQHHHHPALPFGDFAIGLRTDPAPATT